MKKIIPDEGTGIAPLGWYARHGQIFRAYEITYQGEQVEIHILDMSHYREGDDLLTPYTGAVAA